MSTLGEFVRAARKQRRMTQEELAEAIGRSQGYIGRLEAGYIKRPLRDTQAALASALGVTEQEIVQATGQLSEPADGDQEDVAAILLEIGRLPTEQARLAAFDSLPGEIQEAVLLLGEDVFRAARRQRGQ